MVAILISISNLTRLMPLLLLLQDYSKMIDDASMTTLVATVRLAFQYYDYEADADAAHLHQVYY